MSSLHRKFWLLVLSDLSIDSRGSTRGPVRMCGPISRIGTHYSMGMVVAARPKTQSSLWLSADVPSNLMQANIDTNSTCKGFIAKDVISRQAIVVGTYRLVIKERSYNIVAFQYKHDKAIAGKNVGVNTSV